MVGGVAVLVLLIWLGVSVMTEDVPRMATAMADDYQASQASKDLLKKARDDRSEASGRGRPGGTRAPRNIFAKQQTPADNSPKPPDPVLNPDFTKEEMISTQNDGNEY